MFCENCGAKLPEGSRFCVSCGAKVETQPVSPVPPPPPAYAPPAQMPLPPPPAYRPSGQMAPPPQPAYAPATQAPPPPPFHELQPAYGAGVQTQPGSEPLSLGQYIKMFLLLCIPFLNIILLFVWAFGSSVNLNRKNFAKASLILAAISLILWLIAGGAIMRSLFGGYYY